MKGKIKISYDSSPEDFFDAVVGLLDTLGVEYEVTGEEVIIIEYDIKE